MTFCSRAFLAIAKVQLLFFKLHTRLPFVHTCLIFSSLGKGGHLPHVSAYILIQHHFPLLILPWFSQWIDIYWRCVHAFARAAITKYHKVSTVIVPHVWTVKPRTFKDVNVRLQVPSPKVVPFEEEALLVSEAQDPNRTVHENHNSCSVCSPGLSGPWWEKKNFYPDITGSSFSRV